MREDIDRSSEGCRHDRFHPRRSQRHQAAARADGAVVVGGSHGAVYAAYLSAKAGVRAAIHNDAGIGRDEAGVSGLAWAEAQGMAMAAALSGSARIGDGADMLKRGIISRANPLAEACGVKRSARAWPRPPNS